MKQKKCELCGDIFTPTSGRQKCCNKLIVRQCIVCGKDFDSTCSRSPVGTCGPECSKLAKSGYNNSLPERACECCGEMFKPKMKRQVYCGKLITTKCIICGKEISYRCGEYPAEVCSAECQGLYAKQSREENLKSTTRICKWCGKEFVPKDSMDLYCYDKHYKKCVICGREFEIDVRQHKYTETCSKECMGKLMSQNHDYVKGKETQRRNLMVKYGVENPAQIPGVTEKQKQTNLERYGTEWYTQTDEYKQRVKETDMEKYGVEHHLQSPAVIEKRIETVNKKYKVDNVFQSEEIKDRIKQTFKNQYGVEYTSQIPEFKAKATKSARKSTLEQRICTLLDNYGIEYVHHYIIQKDGHSHEFDFYLPQFKLLLDADGLYYHGYLDDPDGVHIREDYDEVRLYLVPQDHLFHVIVEGSEEKQIKQIVDLIEQNAGSLSTYDSIIFKWCRSMSFPYPNYSDKRLKNDWKHLNLYRNDTYVPQCRIGQSLIKQFHKSIYNCKVGNNLSPYEGWNDDNKLRQVIRNRLIYINKVDPSKVLAGFNISKICPCVSTFNPILARYLTLKYLNEFDSVFDPFSGFSGRLLGVASTGKAYIGQDLNGTAIAETNQIIDFLNLDKERYSVTEQDILTCSGDYSCLLTCPPYNKKEIYATETVFKSCDDWIHECIDRFNCKKYVFVVDETEDFDECVVEEIKSASHFSNVIEKVIVIES